MKMYRCNNCDRKLVEETEANAFDGAHKVILVKSPIRPNVSYMISTCCEQVGNVTLLGDYTVHSRSKNG